MSYRFTRSPMGPSSNTPSSQKRQFSNEDDNTFLPPALSSYSIALLNDRTKGSPSSPLQTGVTGIYELDFPERNRTSTLKSRLSVHFKESQRDAASLSTPKDAFKDQVSDINNTSASSHHSSFQDIQNHYSSHNSFNHSSHTHTANSEDEIMENEAFSHNSSMKTPATTPGSSNHSNDDGASQSSVHTIKRIRGTRRFGKVLGPPKRASRLSEHYSKPEIENEKAHKTETPPPFSLEEAMSSVHDNDPQIIDEPESKSALLNNFEKEPSPLDSNDLLSKNKEQELRKRIEEQKVINELQFHMSRVNSPKPQEREKGPLRSQERFEVRKDQENIEPEARHQPSRAQDRPPLHDVPVSMFNSLSNDLESFRKPKIPKTRKDSAPNLHQRSRSGDFSNRNGSGQQIGGDQAFPPLKQFTTESRPFVPLQQQVPFQQPVQQPAQQIVRQPAPKSEEHRKKTIIINGNQYEKLELLGRGGTSKVYKVKALANNRLYAIKKVTFDQFDDACVKGFKGEIDLLLKLKNYDRVVKLVDHAIGEGSIYLVMECGDIDLAHVFQTKLSMNNPLDLHFVKYYSIEMLKCVKAVHHAGIVHSDLKPANFLFVRGILKIIDFGIANAVPDHTANIYRESQIGTPNYMAPEALVEVNQTFPGLPIAGTGQNSHKNTWKVGKPSDVWSCGCIVYQMIYGRPPYGGYSGNQRIMAIMNPQVKITFPNKGIGGIAVPQSAIELMQNCLARNPNERWTVEQCINSDFLKPKVVSENFIRDLVHSAVNYGYNKRINGGGPMTTDVYDTLVDSVLKQIENLNYG